MLIVKTTERYTHWT